MKDSFLVFQLFPTFLSICQTISWAFHEKTKIIKIVWFLSPIFKLEREGIYHISWAQCPFSFSSVLVHPFQWMYQAYENALKSLSQIRRKAMGSSQNTHRKTSSFLLHTLNVLPEHLLEDRHFWAASEGGLSHWRELYISSSCMLKVLGEVKQPTQKPGRKNSSFD